MILHHKGYRPAIREAFAESNKERSRCGGEKEKEEEESGTALQ